MKLLGMDYGKSKVGLALGDTESRVATPFKILKNKNKDFLFKELKKICDEEGIEKIIVGLPINSQAHSPEQVDITQDFICRLEESLNINIEIQDEQLTTRYAKRLSPKGDEDAVAAMIILQSYLDSQ
ncbi:MAG: Holliday junction resolvase RuvX [Patescibacteria group bacterium]|mgnify:CR=1 FL=1